MKDPEIGNEATEERGEFYASLRRSNSQIKADRALEIDEDAALLYKRTVEDLDAKIVKLNRERRSMLDLSPSTAGSLIMASDFNAQQFVDKDIEIGVALRNLEIKLEIAKTRYQQLFKGKQ